MELGSELPHRNLLNSQVERLYLEDLLHQDDLSPNLALLRLIVTPKDQAGLAARQILNSVSTEAEFQAKIRFSRVHTSQQIYTNNPRGDSKNA
ncbi:MAG: DUF2887 domain-containing protein [Aphanizomenon gracile PMC638.10]|nr:DUF2887 domain-containing protein [Aphanizomenon gracile PMC638.10]